MYSPHDAHLRSSGLRGRSSLLMPARTTVHFEQHSSILVEAH